MRKLIFTLIIGLAAVGATAAPIDDAKRLYRDGDYEAALTLLQPLVTKTPRDGNINYWYGATLLALNRQADAVAPLKKALDRNVPDAALALAQISTDKYNAAEARQYYEKYEAMLRKAKKEVPDNIAVEQSRLVLMENMLERVEKIVVIDSLIVDADGFFNHYRLSPEAGRLVPGDMVHLPDAEMAFVPQSNTEIFYSAPDSTGDFILMRADILDDGSIDAALPLEGEDLTGGGSAQYPFLMSDGLTLYFANDGEGSIGGYDIFLTRRDEDGFLVPQNIGMPYNSPFDDYLLAIDEATGVGWWATDRNQIPGKLTIYIFKPSDNRVNVSPDDPALVSLAKLSDITLTQQPGVDYKIKFPEPDTSATAADRPSGDSFELPVGSTTRIYHRLGDFRSAEARQAMGLALNARARVRSIERQLAELRQGYANGNKDNSINILNLEQSLDEARRSQSEYINRAIEAELNN